MLEKQKRWCHEKLEKGKKFAKNHKFGIGIVAGAASTIGLSILKRKIMEPKEMMIQAGTNKDLKEANFLMRVGGIDRFGNESYHSPWVRYEYGEEDKKRICSAIDAAINHDPSGEF